MSVAIIIIGPQGSGKSTQTEVVAKTFHLPIFESGEQLRHLANQKTPLGNRIRQQLIDGQLADNQVVDQLLVSYLSKVNSSHGIVFDGFPRTIDQCQLLADLAHRYNWRIIGLYVTISDQTAKDRLSKRFEVIEGKKVVRPDDTPEIVSHRLQLFHQRTEPILAWLKNKHELLRINGEPSIEIVSHSTIQLLQPFFPL